MIHDLLLSLLTPSVDTMPIASFLLTKESHQFLHSGEHLMLVNIVKIATQYQEIRNFVLQYSTQSRCSAQNISILDASNYADEPLPSGLYLQAFCEGIDQVLCPFRNTLADLERRYLQSPRHSLIFVYQSINGFQLLLTSLLNFLNGVKSQRLHGCALLQYLQQHSLHGNQTVMDAIETIQRSVHRVFLKQLSQWLLFGRFVDIHHEFFIQIIEKRSNDECHHSTFNTSNSGEMSGQRISGSARFIQGNVSDGLNPANSINMDLWRYEINYEQLPQYFSPTWAEKVRFIGQTVVMFNVDPSDEAQKAFTWMQTGSDTTDATSLVGRDALWNNRDQIYANKLQAICGSNRINISQYEPVIDEIKGYVSERLSVIAIKQADLVNQLRLIKDFYLLGRGEFYLEFIKQTRSVLDAPIIDAGVARTITTAFSAAAQNINIADDLDQFSLVIPLDDPNHSQNERQGFIQGISLKYNVKWPLHLLFSPRIIEGYNEMFRFLLQIKRVQYALHNVWCDHREKKMTRNSQLLQLRNKFMFLVDNLQYYLQADVLESQFSILMQTVQESRDFEHIQRAHTVFQANILSLCFLLTNHAAAGSMAATTMNRTDMFAFVVDNPVLQILNQIMMRVLIFCKLSYACSDPMTEELQRSLESCDVMFSNHVADLMKLLVGLNAGPSSAPLAQLLLRLDYNYWFSSQQAKQRAELEEADDVDEGF